MVGFKNLWVLNKWQIPCHFFFFFLSISKFKMLKSKQYILLKLTASNIFLHTKRKFIESQIWFKHLFLNAPTAAKCHIMHIMHIMYPIEWHLSTSVLSVHSISQAKTHHCETVSLTSQSPPEKWLGSSLCLCLLYI